MIGPFEDHRLAGEFRKAAGLALDIDRLEGGSGRADLGGALGKGGARGEREARKGEAGDDSLSGQHCFHVASPVVVLHSKVD